MIRLAVRVRRADAELVLADLMAFAPGGLEEVDHGDVVEYVLYGAAGELPALGEVRAVAGDALVEVSTAELAEVDWRSFHAPIDAGPLRIRPPWEPARDGTLDVVIPRRLSARQRELLEELRDTLTEENLGSQEGMFAKLKRALRA